MPESDRDTPQNPPHDLEKLLDLVPDLIFRVDRDLRHLYVNQRVLDMTGLSREQYLGKTNRELDMPEALCDLWDRTFLNVFREGRPQDIEFSYPSFERLRDLQMRVAPEKAPDGTVLTAVGITRDITAQKKADADQKSTEELFHSVFEHMSSGVAIYEAVEGGEDFVFKAFNAAAERITRISREKALGKRLLDLFPQMEKAGLLGALQRVWKTGQEEHLPPFHYKDETREGWRENQIYKLPSGEVVSLFDDVTERKQAEKALRESEERSHKRLLEIETIYSSAPIGMCVLDKNLRFLRVNDRLAEINGIPANDHIGKTIWDVVPDLAHMAESISKRIFETGEPELNVEFSGATQSQPGVERHWVEHWLPLKNSSGDIIGINVVADEITEHKRKEEALRESEERVRIAVEGGRLGTWDRDLTTDEVVWNPFLYDLIGRDPNGPAITGETFFKYIHPDDIERVRIRFNDTIQKGEDFFDEFRILREDGDVRWLASTGRVYRDSKGRPLRMAGVTYDITERKRMEEELRRHREELEVRVQERTKAFQRQYEQRKLLSGRLVELLEKDRAGIAMALHDNVGQLLSGCRINLELVKNELPAGPALEKIATVKTYLGEAIDFIRNISHELRPSSLDKLGLMPCLETLITDMKRNSGISIKFFNNHIPEKLDSEKSLALYRIVQESLNNITKHADADEVFINLMHRDDTIHLSVEDNGRGFDYQEKTQIIDSDQGPLGLGIMRERAIQIGGTLWIETGKGKGTTVLVEIPLKEDARDQ